VSWADNLVPSSTLSGVT